MPRRSRAVLAGLLGLLVPLLTACGASAYCTAVEENRGAFDEVTVSTASFTALAEALRAIEAEAPSGIRGDYGTVAEAVEVLLAVEEKTGVPLEELTYDDVTPLPQEEIDDLRAAYQDFNETASQRRAIADHVDTECDITLLPPGGSPGQ